MAELSFGTWLAAKVWRVWCSYFIGLEVDDIGPISKAPPLTLVNSFDSCRLTKDEGSTSLCS